VPYDDIYLEADDGMEKVVAYLKSEMRTMRSGRATPGIVENIRVEYYGTKSPLNQVASVQVPDPSRPETTRAMKALVNFTRRDVRAVELAVAMALPP